MKFFNPSLSLLMVCLLSVGALPAQAQQKMSLSLEKAVEMGISSSKSLHSSKAKIDAASAKIRETDANNLPTLSFQGGYTRLSAVDPFTFTPPGTTTKLVLSEPVLDNFVLQLTLQQPIFTGFRLSSASQMAEYNAQATKVESLKDKSDVALAVKNAYWNLYKAQELRKVNNENVAQIKAHLKDIQALQQGGLATYNDVLKVQVQISDAQYRQIDAQNLVQLTQVSLNNYLGLPLTTELELTTAAQSGRRDGGSWENSLETATKQRPEIRAAELRMKAGEEGVTMAKSAWYPQVSVGAHYNLNNPNQRIQPPRTQFDGTWDVGVNVSMNLWNWGITTEQTSQAELQVIQAQDAIGQIKDGINVEVTQSYLTLNQAKEKLKVAQEGIKQAEENLRLTNERLKNGVALSTDVIDADYALLLTKTNLTNAIVDVELAYAKLQKALGEE
ncbi:MAG: TolC family protein [Candidatus Kapaibacterium sp.]